MKKHLSIILVLLVVLGQLTWLGYNYHARTQELEAAPTIIVPCMDSDPRDLFRGDYVTFLCGFSYSLTDPLFNDVLHWDNLPPHTYGDGGATVKLQNGEHLRVPVEQIKPVPARAATNPDSVLITADDEYKVIPMAAFWVPGGKNEAQLVRLANRGSAQDVAREGEVRTAVTARVSHFSAHQSEEGYVTEVSVRLMLCVSDSNSTALFRYYVPEGEGDVFRAWRECPGSEGPFPSGRVQTSAELVCRGNSGLVVRELYMNGIPWLEAIDRIRKGTFPFRD